MAMTKIILFIIAAMLPKIVFAGSTTSEPIVIELGEDYTLKGVTSKIWIENAKIISAASTARGLLLKSNSIGQTLIRQNNQLIKVTVVPTGSQKTYKEWLRLSQKFVNVSVHFCEDVVCLKGKLFRFEDFKKIIGLIDQNESSLYLALEVDEDLRVQLNLWFENRLREAGLTPMKIMYGQPWRLTYSSKETAADYKGTARKFGLLAVENKQKIEIADNIHVEVKIAEVKKDFVRKLGIRWPSQYSAHILDGQTSIDPILALLNADETDGDIKILAKPNLVCRSGKEAEFFAGGEFPIKVLNYKFQDIVWKKYGILMKIKPTIDSIGQMSLGIESEISSIDDSRAAGDIPALFANRVSSFFDLVESKTIALSGLIKNETGRSSEGLPFLSSLPVLGSLFSSKTFRENKSDLIIFVTPKLMKAETSL